jgi:hypothetical protein
MMEKTASEWFDMLIEPYCSQAKENSLLHRNDRDRKYPSLSYCLCANFSWDVTPQGGKYWDELYNSIASNETTYLKHIKSNQPQLGEWIKVGDGLPNANQYVIIYDGKSETPSVKDFFYYSNVKGFVSFGTQEVNNFVTHWMPLPAPPKE